MIEINFSVFLQVICILIFYLVLSRFIFKPILSILEERRGLIQGKRQKAAESKEESDKKSLTIQEALDSCKKELDSELQQKVLNTQKVFSKQMAEVEEQTRQNLRQIKDEIEQDLQSLKSGVEKHAEPLYRLVRNKLRV
jgi:F-type H+-transporting ATPase subunit b